MLACCRLMLQQLQHQQIHSSFSTSRSTRLTWKTAISSAVVGTFAITAWFSGASVLAWTPPEAASRDP